MKIDTTWFFSNYLFTKVDIFRFFSKFLLLKVDIQFCLSYNQQIISPCSGYHHAQGGSFRQKCWDYLRLASASGGRPIPPLGYPPPEGERNVWVVTFAFRLPTYFGSGEATFWRRCPFRESQPYCIGGDSWIENCNQL